MHTIHRGNKAKHLNRLLMMSVIKKNIRLAKILPAHRFAFILIKKFVICYQLLMICKLAQCF